MHSLECVQCLDAWKPVQYLASGMQNAGWLACKERMRLNFVELGESFAFAARNESLAYFVCLAKCMEAWATEDRWRRTDDG